MSSRSSFCVCVRVYVPPWCKKCIYYQRSELPGWVGGFPPAVRCWVCTRWCSARTHADGSADPPEYHSSRSISARSPAHTHKHTVNVGMDYIYNAKAMDYIYNACTSILFWIQGPTMLAWVANWRRRWSLDFWRLSSSCRASSRWGTRRCTYAHTHKTVLNVRLNFCHSMPRSDSRWCCLCSNKNTPLHQTTRIQNPIYCSVK